MVALQHTPSLQRPAAAAQAQQQPQAAPRQLQASRRAALGAALLLPAAAVALPLPPALAAEVAADAAAAASAVAGGAPAPEALDVVSWPQWVDRNFSFAYPPGLREAPSSAFEQPLPRNAAGNGGAVRAWSAVHAAPMQACLLGLHGVAGCASFMLHSCCTHKFDGAAPTAARHECNQAPFHFCPCSNLQTSLGRTRSKRQCAARMASSGLMWWCGRPPPSSARSSKLRVRPPALLPQAGLRQMKPVDVFQLDLHVPCLPTRSLHNELQTHAVSSYSVRFPMLLPPSCALQTFRSWATSERWPSCCCRRVPRCVLSAHVTQAGGNESPIGARLLRPKALATGPANLCCCRHQGCPRLHTLHCCPTNTLAGARH